MAVRLHKLSIEGFKSFRELCNWKPGPLNVLIGANGAGKSNFISFFRLLSWMMNGGLQEHLSRLGGANFLLHDGADTTRGMKASLTLGTDQGDNDYVFRLFYAAGDTLIFADERCRFSRAGHQTSGPWRELQAGHREAAIIDEAEKGDTTARTIRYLLRQCVVHQFHNTSETARMRAKWNVDDNRQLKEDGANLAPFLLRLQESEPRYYHRIVETLRQILPFFSGFELEPEHGSVMLRWRERDSDVVFSASQASDGMLRIIALTTLLLQPECDLPGVLILDEPELGLHPYALTVLAGLLRSASTHVQVIVATQSATLVDQFEPEDIVVVDRVGRESTFTRLDAEKLHDWLEEYSVSELWEKNVVGGRPGG